MKVSYRTQTVGDFAVFYRKAVPVDSPVVLLLHGLLISSRIELRATPKLLRPAPAPRTPQPWLTCVGQPHNFGAESAWIQGELQMVADFKKTEGLLANMYSGHLLTAAVVGSVAAAGLANIAESAWLNHAKRRGIPIVFVLAHGKSFTAIARFCKKVFAGAMRQGYSAIQAIAAISNVSAATATNVSARSTGY